MAGIYGKCPWGGSEPGRRLKVTEDKEALITRLRKAGKRITAIARLVGLSRQTCYSVLERAENGEKDHEASLEDCEL